MTPASLCLVVHDVAPATWPECERLLAMVAALGRPPVTLLVVPAYHRGLHLDQAPAVIDAIDAWCVRGAEVGLHGYRHEDDGRPPSTPLAWLQRRVLTAGEGEFAALSQGESLARIRAGQAMFASLGWNVQGFVPPAWLAGPGARRALRESALHYSSAHGGLIRLADGARIAAPCITASARSAWRQVASRSWMAAAAAATRRAPLLRVALHPADARHPYLMSDWQRLLARLLAEREALTKSQAMERFACAARPSFLSLSPWY